MIENLRKEHFKLGEQNPVHMRTSSSIGSGLKESQKRESVPWAHSRTNIRLGGDEIPKATDYQNRFASAYKTTSNFRHVESNPFDESKKIKAKITSDSVRIAGNDYAISTVSSKL